MNTIQEIFNNREIAIGLWIILAVFLLLFTKPAREFLKTVLPILFCKKFVVFYIVFLSYLAVVLYVLNWAGWWDFELLKDTIFWVLFVELPLFTKAIEKADGAHFFRKLLKDNTLNYDNNIESLIHKEVYHLHGDFSVLANSENPETVLGYIRRSEGKTVCQPEMKHCYCNALLNYSGKLKYKTAVANHKAILDSEHYAERYNSDSSFRKAISTSNSLETQMIRTKIEHPELKMATEYYFYEFESIEGQLEIIGLSPNNDAHIFNAILDNTNITKVIFYYFDEKERTFIEEHYPRDLFECQRVQDLWKTLRSERKVYNCNYCIPNAGREIIDVLNVLSDDEISFEEIKKRINRIPQFQMRKLSKAVKEELQKRNPNNSILNPVEFEQEQASICHIALQEGIPPSVLYLVYMMS